MAERAPRQTTTAGFPDPAADERRALRRSPVLWAGLLRDGMRLSGCVVLDVSATGASVRLAERETEEGGPRTLEVPRLGALSCEIAWREGRRLGLRFRDGAAEVAARLDHALPRPGI